MYLFIRAIPYIKSLTALLEGPYVAIFRDLTGRGHRTVPGQLNLVTAYCVTCPQNVKYNRIVSDDNWVRLPYLFRSRDSFRSRGLCLKLKV